MAVTQIHSPTPLLGFVAYSGTGKTTLLEKLIPQLKTAGLHIALIKHAHHDFDIDIPGKDSYRLRKAGAEQMMVASRQRWALVTELDKEQSEPCLQELLQHLDHEKLDLILVEGFKHEGFAKIELHRPALGKGLLFPEDDTIIALASDDAGAAPCPIPQLDINQPAIIARFVLEWLQDAHK